jgi:hypothetical protein
MEAGSAIVLLQAENPSAPRPGAMPSDLRSYCPLLTAIDRGYARRCGPDTAQAAIDLLHAMQFRPSPPLQVRAVRPAYLPPRSDRDCPLGTARDRCLWHADGTAGENDEARPWRRMAARSARGQVRPWYPLHHGQEPEGSRQRWETQPSDLRDHNLTRPVAWRELPEPEAGRPVAICCAP